MLSSLLQILSYFFSCHSIKFDVSKRQTRLESILATGLGTFYCSVEFLAHFDNPSAALMFMLMTEHTAETAALIIMQIQ